MKILFVTSEVAPYSKSGGLADVAFSLPPALLKAGHEIAVVSPLYQCVRSRFGDTLEKVMDLTIRHNTTDYATGLWKGERNGVTMWFVEYDAFFDRPKLYGYDDDKLRFAYFSRTVIEILDKLDFRPEILHCNDWETAPVVIYLKNDQAWRESLRGIKTVYTIHNIAYQGQFGAEELSTTFALPGGWYDGGLGYEFEGRHDINLMKGAMLMADAVSTVSPTYAKELHQPTYGMGLQGVADIIESKLFGILNGIDMAHYDPSIDPVIPANFTVADRSGKAVCKKSIQHKFGLVEEPKWPLLCSVARLNEQKGIELIKAILPGIMEMGVQLIVFGQGEQKYIDFFNDAMKLYPGQLGFSSDYSEAMASEIFAGADMYLMPSRFEPCGLSQMMAMRYGTVPIVHEVGGLKDSVRPYKSFDGMGDGFSFASYQPKDLYLTILDAVRLYFGSEDVFETLRDRCMTKDFSWDKSAESYNRMYSEIFDGAASALMPFDEGFAALSKAYRAIDDKNNSEKSDKYREDYHRIIQFNMSGKCIGEFYIEFTSGEPLKMLPGKNFNADAVISTSYENLIGMATGTVSQDEIFMNGQLKVNGSLVAGAEMKDLLSYNG